MILKYHGGPNRFGGTMSSRVRNGNDVEMRWTAASTLDVAGLTQTNTFRLDQAAARRKPGTADQAAIGGGSPAFLAFCLRTAFPPHTGQPGKAGERAGGGLGGKCEAGGQK